VRSVLLRSLATTALFCITAAGANAQQVPDPDFNPPIPNPEFDPGEGPLVLVDAAHNNFHTADGRYGAFARLLERDGYVVGSNEQPFTRAVLSRGAVMVIANAIADENVGDWVLPTPSAFTDGEIDAVVDWVSRGGSLLLIADHMPIAGNAEALAAAFGLRFYNGFAFDEDGGGAVLFSRAAGTLRETPVSNGRHRGERVDSIATFTGQAFRVDPGVEAEPLLVLPDGYTVWLPEVAWEFSDATPRVSGAHLLQGALLRYGEGRLAVFGEAAMFSAQLAGPNRTPMGMSRPEAAQNPQLVLNVIHWLTDRY
jgi:hypothetical protein